MPDPKSFPQLQFRNVVTIEGDLLKPFVQSDEVMTIGEYKKKFNILSYLDIRLGDLEHTISMYQAIRIAGGCKYFVFHSCVYAYFFWRWQEQG